MSTSMMDPAFRAPAAPTVCDPTDAEAVRRVLETTPIADFVAMPHGAFEAVLVGLQRTCLSTPPSTWLPLWSLATRVYEECVSWLTWHVELDTTDAHMGRLARQWAGWVERVWTPFDVSCMRLAVVASGVPVELAAKVAQWAAMDAGASPASMATGHEAGAAEDLATHLAEIVSTYHGSLARLSFDDGQGARPLSARWIGLSHPDASRRRATHAAFAAAVSAQADGLDALWRDMHASRCRVAVLGGCTDPMTAYYDEQNRDDQYSMEDAREFAAWVRVRVGPIYRQIAQRRAEALGQTRWDVSDSWTVIADTPIPPVDAATLWGEVRAAFSAMHPTWAPPLDAAMAAGRIAIAGTPTQAPGWQALYAPRSRQASIMGTMSGTLDDVVYLAHECGHAVHAFARDRSPWIWLADVDGDVSEIVAMGMEALVVAAPDHLVAAPETPAADRAALARWQSDASRNVLVSEWLWQNLRLLMDWTADEIWQQWLWRQPAGTVSLREAASARDAVVRWLDGRPRADAGDADGDAAVDDAFAVATVVVHSHVWESPGYAFEYALAHVLSLAVFASARDDLASTAARWQALMRRRGVLVREACESAELPWPLDPRQRADMLDLLLVVQDDLAARWPVPSDAEWVVDASRRWSPRRQRLAVAAARQTLEQWLTGTSELGRRSPSSTSSSTSSSLESR